jgi:hypothetical protein
MQYSSFILEEIWSRNNASYLLTIFTVNRKLQWGYLRKRNLMIKTNKFLKGKMNEKLYWPHYTRHWIILNVFLLKQTCIYSLIWIPCAPSLFCSNFIVLISLVLVAGLTEAKALMVANSRKVLENSNRKTLLNLKRAKRSTLSEWLMWT